MIDKLYEKYPAELLENIEDAVNKILYQFAEETDNFPDIENVEDLTKFEVDTVRFLGISMA